MTTNPYQTNPYATPGPPAQPGGPWGAQILPATPPPPPAPRRRRGAIAAIVAGAVGVAAIGVGATVAIGALSGGGEQADAVLPANAVVAATFDLDPSASQKIDALRFAKKFPETADLDWGTASDPRRWVYEKLTERAENAPVWSEVDSWLGDRAGVALLPPAPGEVKPVAVLALQVTDQERARVSLSSLRSGKGALAGLAGEGDWVVLAETDADAAEALASARSAPLAESPTYAADLDALGEQGVASVWVDYARLQALSGVLGRGASVTALTGQVPVTGHGAATLRFTGGDLEIVGSVRDQDQTQLPSGSPVALAAPSDAAAVLSMTGLGDMVMAQWDNVVGAAGAAGGAFGADIAQMERATGLSLPADLATLLGRQTTVMVTSDAGRPQVSLAVVGEEGPALDGALGRLERALVDAPGVRAQRTADGYTLAFGGAFPAVDGAGLAATAAFADAVPDASSAQVIGYADIARVSAMLPSSTAQERADLAPLQAFGFSAGRDADGGTSFRVKLTTR